LVYFIVFIRNNLNHFTSKVKLQVNVFFIKTKINIKGIKDDYHIAHLTQDNKDVFVKFSYNEL